MKERGLVLDAATIRGLLTGATMQLRRPVKAPRGWTVLRPLYAPQVDDQNPSLGLVWMAKKGSPNDATMEARTAPLGTRGSRIWVRETYCTAQTWYPAAQYAYRADYLDHEWREHVRGCPGIETGVPASFDCMACHFERWIPAVRMPRRASRIDLKIEDVTVLDGPEGLAWVYSIRRVYP